MSNRRLKLDLHSIYNDGTAITRTLEEIIDEAEACGAKQVEIVYGKGSGQLRKRVMRFLMSKEIRPRYHRLEKDQHNHGRVFVHLQPQ